MPIISRSPLALVAHAHAHTYTSFPAASSVVFRSSSPLRSLALSCNASSIWKTLSMHILSSSVCVCVCECTTCVCVLHVSVSVCVCYMCLCVCVCMCVCETTTKRHINNIVTCTQHRNRDEGNDADYTAEVKERQRQPYPEHPIQLGPKHRLHTKRHCDTRNMRCVRLLVIPCTHSFNLKRNMKYKGIIKLGFCSL